MKTDIPLKRLTRLCPTDLLPLLGSPPAQVIGVETLELPASKTSLDTVLHLRDATNQDYLHLIEWQGYADPVLLWRTLGYLAWIGQHRTERPVLVTIVYLSPADDTGDTLIQSPAIAGGWAVQFTCVRLWEHDATAALASGSPGLLVLAPLMGGATSELVEHAAQTLIAEVAPPIQGELLAALGMLAEPLLDSRRFVQLVTKERLMATDLISYLVEEKTAELVQEKTALEEEFRHVLQQTLEDAIIARFPTAPLSLTRAIRTISDRERLQALIRDVLRSADLPTVEQMLTQAQAEG